MSPARTRVGRRLCAGIASVALCASGAAALSPAASAAAAHSTGRNSIPDKTASAGNYVVVLTDQPETAYDGHLRGYSATRPQSGESFNADAAAVRNYRSYLTGRQDQVLSRVGNPRTIYRYTTALSGFTAKLTGAQVAQLRAMPDVLSVTRDRLIKSDTVHSPKFLGLTGRHGVWAQHGGPKKAGKHIVVGSIDSGIWPQNPSFAGKAKVPHVRGFNGICQAGERWKHSTCNSKIIAARYFVKGFGVKNIANRDYISPRDSNGHGSHTASTAAGNHGVKVAVAGQSLGRASGMAPAAKISVYKALWNVPGLGAGFGTTSDLVAAINQATQDGVDVINYSISGGQDLNDPVEIAFLGAASAGIFVAASAGNSGPFRSTVAHPSPWVATVAASTHYLYQGAVRLGNGKSYVGAMFSNKAVSMRRIVLSRRVADKGADPAEAALCFPGTLDKKRVKNKIVVCDRGINDRVEKSLTVKRAGGAGMVLVNVDDTGTVADAHSVPTVHLEIAAGAAVKAYVAKKGKKARAALDPSAHDNTPIPQIAGFSSRGPLVGDPDILKPDLSAPGVDVVAAVSPPGNSGERWAPYSGTSMASPHVAGLAAFIEHARPSWSPAMIKSAMMTTAYNLKRGHSPFTQGAGHVRPTRFLNPGLVYDARFNDWVDLLTGAVRMRNLNQASIALGQVVGSATVHRAVTNVTNNKETYKANVSGLKGLNVQVAPMKFTVRPGHTKHYKVTFTATKSTKFKHYAKGHLTWTGSRGHKVRSPVVARPVAVSVPGDTRNAGVSGSMRIHGRAGFTGQLDLGVVGLKGATPTPGSVAQGDQQRLQKAVIPAGTAVARFDLNADDDSSDLDLYVFSGGSLVAASATLAADEQVTLLRPAAGTYKVVVDGYAAGSGGSPIPYTYTGWVVPKKNRHNLSVTPDPVPVQSGERFSYRASWSGLTPTKRYFGFVKYKGYNERTYVTINP